MYKFVCFFVFISLALTLYSAAVDQSTALTVAYNWLNHHNNIRERGIEITLQDSYIHMVEGQAIFYVFNFDPEGFVIVAADDGSKPVLGYNYTGRSALGDFPPNMYPFLTMYEQSILRISEENLSNAGTIGRWTAILSNDIPLTRHDRSVEPLLTTKWNQNNPWNILCPEDPEGPGGYVYAGCVAVAMAQVMRYWSYPEQGAGYHSYEDDNYGFLEADFGATTYNWGDMPHFASTHSIAELLFQLGVSVEMMYGNDSSGAYPEDVRDPLVNHFGYDSGAELVLRSNYTSGQWISLLKEQLDAGYPMFYVGYPSFALSGHAFNCDGYDADDNFHFNWGWSGSNDGYYSITGHTYNVGQQAIINQYPDIPLFLKATPDDTTVELSWRFMDNRNNPRQRNLLGFILFRDDVQINPTLISGDSFIDTGLINGAMYGYRVEAVYSSGNPDVSNLAFAMPLYTGVEPAGSGLSINPYEIETFENLFWIWLNPSEWDRHFIQTADIDASLTETWHEGWFPIGHISHKFKGSYNGQFHSIEGLYIARQGQDGIGLFGHTDGANIANLKLIDTDITGGNNVGALTGQASNGTIIRYCSVDADVQGENRVGGLVGSLRTGSEVLSSFSIGSVNASSGIGGGLVGNSNNSFMANNFSKATVFSPTVSGGLVGHLDYSEITNCFSTGSVSGYMNIGGLLGWRTHSEVHYSYWNTQTSGLSMSPGGEGRTTAQMTYPYSSNTYQPWDFTDTWQPDEDYEHNAGYPALIWQLYEQQFSVAPTQGNGSLANPYQIASLENLYWITEDHQRWNYHYIQTTNISAYDSRLFFNGKGWQPIGSFSISEEYHPFTGSYDGQGFTIAGLYINRPDQRYLGLFGNISGGIVKDLRLTEISFSTDNYSGGLAGLVNTGSLIENCFVTGIFNGLSYCGGLVGRLEDSTLINSSSNLIINGRGSLGGIVGESNNSTISSSYNNGTVQGSHTLVGGLAGLAESTTVTNCYNTGSVSGSSTNVGGLIGRVVESIVSYTYNTGNVSSTNERAGGLLGSVNSSEVSHSYNSGNVSGRNDSGGLIGFVYNSSVHASFNTGTVTGYSYVGGLTGHLNAAMGEESIMTECYSRGNVSGNSIVGGLIGQSNVTTITNSYATGNVTAHTGKGGGLIGRCHVSTVINCYSNGFVSASPGNSGGLIAYSYVNYEITNCYWDTVTSGQPMSDGGEERTTEQMTYPYAVNTYVDWDFSEIWAGDTTYEENNGYPYLDSQAAMTPVATPPHVGNGSAAQPYEIATLENLSWMAADPARWDYHYRQTADIEASVTRNWYYGEGWLPVGIYLGYNHPGNEPFTGSYDGQGYNISGIFIDRSASDNISFWGYTNEASIENLGLTGLNIRGGNYTGGLIGQSESTTVQNCYSNGIINGVNYVGGLIGENYSSTVSRSFSSCNVNGMTGNIGGLVGRNYNSSLLNCYSTGNVTGSDTVGGLAGYNYGLYNYINYCYSTGSVSGNNATGGLVGYNYGYVLNSYWNTETSGQGTSSGGAGRTTAEMTHPYAASTYENWNFTDLWTEDTSWEINDGYPFHRWRIPPLAGVYSIAQDGSGDFPSFNAALTFLKLAGVSAPVTFEITPGNYNEQILFQGEIPGATEDHTVTFTGLNDNEQAVNLQFAPTESENSHVIRFNDTAHLRIDNLTIEVLEIPMMFSWPVQILHDSHDITVTNCLIKPYSILSFGILLNGSLTDWNAGASNVSDILLENNTVIGGYHGLLLLGIDQNDRIENVTVRNNSILDSFLYGINVRYAENLAVNQNTIDIYSETEDILEGAGIYLEHIAEQTFLTGNQIIHPGQYGIYLANMPSSPYGNHQVHNNMIGGGFRNTGSTTSGIYLGADVSFFDIHYNSINVDRGSGAAIYIEADAEVIRLMNNSFAYTGSFDGRAAYYANPASISSNDYNNYYTGSSANFIYFGGEIADLTPLQNVGHDLHSQIDDPLYISPYDLHSQGMQLWAQGTPIQGISLDIDGDTRDQSNPCIGADEYIPVDHDLAATSLIGPDVLVMYTENEYQITVTNVGIEPQNVYTVKLMLADEELSNRRQAIRNSSRRSTELASLLVNAPLEPGDSVQHTMSWTPESGGDYQLYGRVLLYGDMNPLNNDTSLQPVHVTIPISEFPFSEGFDEVEPPALPTGWTVENSNDDHRYWLTATTNHYSPPNAIHCLWNNDLAADDWFFTPPVLFIAGYTYELSFMYRSHSANYYENLKVQLGSAPHSSAMTGEIIFDQQNFNHDFYQQASVTFSVAETGVYHLGWHKYSIAYQWGVYVDDILIEMMELELAAPLVTIEITGGNAILSWEPVEGANSYLIYASEDPHSDFPTDWEGPLIIGQPGYTEPLSFARRFFRVKASLSTPPTLRKP